MLGTDSGRISILEYSPSLNQFTPVHQEPYGRSGLRRIVPGHFLSVDPQGRALLLGALEKQKFVYVLNRDADAKLTISSPLEAHRAHTLTEYTVAMDVGFENPLFAALEVDYGDLDQDTAGEAHQDMEKQLSLYELDLGLNHVVRKWSERVQLSSNLLVALPGGQDGPGGVLVCSEDLITWKNMNHDDVSIQVPRPIEHAKRPTLITAAVVHKMKNTFFALLQTEHGHLFKLTVDYDRDRVRDMQLQYFDTLPAALALNVFKSGFLFSASEFGDAVLFQIESLGDDDVEAFVISSSSMRDGEDEVPTFKRRQLKNLAPVHVLESLSPLMDSKLVADTTGQPQIITFSGRGSHSKVSVLTPGLEVSELVSYPLPAEPTHIWSIKSQQDSEWDAYMVISFINATLVLSIGETVEEVTDQSGFLDSVGTLWVCQMGADAIVQVHSQCVRLILGANKGVQEWKAPSKIVHASSNNQQLVVALTTNQLVYFEIDEYSTTLNEYEDHRDVPAEIKCLAVGPLVASRKRSPFLAVGLGDETVRIVSLDPDNCLEPIGMQALTATPSSVLFTQTQEYGSATTSTDISFSTLYLNVGLENGVMIRSVMDWVMGTLSDSRSRYLGPRSIRLHSISIAGSEAVLGLSSQPWLAYTYNRKSYTSPLQCEAMNYASAFRSEQCEEGIVAISGSTLRILLVEKLGREFKMTSAPLGYTPRQSVVLDGALFPGGESSGKVVVVLETEHNARFDQRRLKLEQQNGSRQNADGEDDEEEEEVWKYVPELEKAGDGKWVSQIRLINCKTLETRQILPLANNEAAFSVSSCVFHSDQSSTYVIVGVGKDMTLKPPGCRVGYVDTYKVTEHGLTFVHRTEVESVPYALCAFQGRLLVGIGNILRIYDLGKAKLLRKCENKSLPNNITALQTQGDRIYIQDIQESVHFAHYVYQENKVTVFADDTRPRWMTRFVVLDYNTVAGADKFGNVFVMRLPREVAEGVDDDLTRDRILNEKPRLMGAPHKLELICQYFVGEMVTSLQRGPMIPGGREVLLYTTLSGTIGILIPFASKEDVDLFQQLEIRMRAQVPILSGRDHQAFRSYYLPVKNVVDGGLVAEFDGILSMRQKSDVAEALERSVSEISRQIELLRARVA